MKKPGKNINNNNLNDCIFWYKYPEKHQNGIAVLKISNVPAGEYDVKINMTETAIIKILQLFIMRLS